MKVYILHINWCSGIRDYSNEGREEVGTFSTPEKTFAFFKKLLTNHRFSDNKAPVLRYKRKDLSLEEVWNRLLTEGRYWNDWFGAPYIHPFKITLLKDEV